MMSLPLLEQALSIKDKRSILEPFMALIVDQTAMKDPLWPNMFSTLIDAGIVSYFHDIASTPVSDPNDRSLWRSITDALVGLMRCFESISKVQSLDIPHQVADTLDRLADDDSLPLIVQRSANDARGALRRYVTFALLCFHS